MVRPSQQLHPSRPPAAPEAAAVLLLVKDTPGGIEVLMTRRSLLTRFAPGAYVFPGGRAEEADALARPVARRRRTQSRQQLVHAITAVRETFEELGILLAKRLDGRPVTAELVAKMNRDTRGGVPLALQCSQQGLHLSTDQVWVLANWISDRDHLKRFDVQFLVARMPEGQIPVADEVEQFEPIWVRPIDALTRHEAGTFPMIFPVARTLQRLLEYTRVDALIAACAHETPLWTSCPRGGWQNGREVRFTENERPYGELALTCPDGQLQHTLDWQTHTPVRLLKNVQRLTAPNANMMTGPGTNTYIVGDDNTGYVVIDPGPNDFGHVGRIWRLTNGDIRAIVCTHSHADHSPGAQPLQTLCKDTHPPILGLPSAPTARPSDRFAPDRVLKNHERITLQDDPQSASVTHTLRVLYTPGHAANHLCLFLEEDGLLFSGDHILNGSTTVINPPDGHMGNYLDSLDRLSEACAEMQVDFILPAHGYVLTNAQKAIAQLKRHRLQRESKVAAAMRQNPDGSLEDWLPVAYDDTPPHLRPVALRSLQAHVERLRETNDPRLDPASPIL